MATALEFYKANTVTPANFTGAYSNYLTCTANRTGKAGTKNFFIIAHIVENVSTTTVQGKIRLQVDSGDIGEVADGIFHVSTTRGYTHNFVKRVSLDNTSHSITLDCGRVNGVANFIAMQASIVVLEESAGAEYAESAATTGTGVSSGWEDYLGLSFSPASTQKYLLAFSCETYNEDESQSGMGGIQFIETDIGPTTYLSENDGDLGDSFNDSIHRTVGGACFDELSSESTYNFKIQMKGTSASNEVYCRKGAIVAIPFGDFENVYTDSQSAKTFHTGTSFTDTDVVMAAQACNAADHLIIAAIEFSAEAAGNYGNWRLRSDGVDFEERQFHDRDEDSDEYFIAFQVHGKTLTSGNKNFEIEGNSGTTHVDYEGCGRNGYLIVAEIPAGEVPPPPSWIPKIITVS